VRFTVHLRGADLALFGGKFRDAMRATMASVLLRSAGDDRRIALTRVSAAAEDGSGAAGVRFRVGLAPSSAAERAAVEQRLRDAADFTQPVVGRLVTYLRDEQALPSDAVLKRLRVALVLDNAAAAAAAVAVPVGAALPTPAPASAPTPTTATTTATATASATAAAAVPPCSLSTGAPATECSGDMTTPRTGTCDPLGRCRCHAPFVLSADDGRCWHASDLSYNVATLIDGLLSHDSAKVQRLAAHTGGGGGGSSDDDDDDQPGNHHVVADSACLASLLHWAQEHEAFLRLNAMYSRS